MARRCRHLPGLVFFDHALDANDGTSVIAAEPSEIITGTDWDSLAGNIAARGATKDGLRNGIAAGYVNYDGTFVFGFYDAALVYDHAQREWQEPASPKAWMRELDLAENKIGPRFLPEISSPKFCEMVDIAQGYITAGDIYQVNLAQRFSAEWNSDPWEFYESLRRYSPAPYAAYLELGGRTILSASPELFLKVKGREIVTRPIKGTRPRGLDSTSDERSAYDLITSPKEIAELVMITDLERNDLGMVCEYGSVEVSELLALEQYEQVFHLVSTVHGRLRAEVDHVGALRSCFPGGSITGAPKKRAREIIHELEPCPRGLYTGAIGYFGFNGESQFNIAIRTVICERGTAHFHVGAGIVADSIAEREYQETLDKAAGILLAAERLGG